MIADNAERQTANGERILFPSNKPRYLICFTGNTGLPFILSLRDPFIYYDQRDNRQAADSCRQQW